MIDIHDKKIEMASQSERLLCNLRSTEDAIKRYLKERYCHEEQIFDHISALLNMCLKDLSNLNSSIRDVAAFIDHRYDAHTIKNFRDYYEEHIQPNKD